MPLYVQLWSLFWVTVAADLNQCRVLFMRTMIVVCTHVC